MFMEHSQHSEYISFATTVIIVILSRVIIYQRASAVATVATMKPKYHVRIQQHCVCVC